MANGYWICADETPTEAKEYRFTKTFKAKKGAVMKADVSADGRYQLLVNGKYVCEGPCQGSQFEQFYESVDLSEYLVEGENTLTIRQITLPAGDNFFINTYRFGRPAIWFDGVLTEAGKETPIFSDGGFSCARVDSICYRQQEYGALTSISPSEDWLGEEVLVPVEVKCQYIPSLKEYSVYGVSEPRMMYPRPIPLLKQEADKPFTVLHQGDGFVELCGEKYTTAFLTFALKGKKGSRVRITYAECYVDENGKKGRRDATEGKVEGPTDSIVMTGEEQFFTTFFFRAFRIIRLHTEDGSAFTFDVKKSHYNEYFYPFDLQGKFRCSDETLNKMWETSIHTLRCCTHELFVDCPYYEQQQYDQDGSLEMLVGLRISNDPRMARKIISNFAHSQRPNGYLQANYPSTLVQMIGNFPLFWVFMLRDHLAYTGDLAFSRKMHGTMLKMLDAYDENLTKDGLVGRTDFWHFVDWVPWWEYGVPNFGKDEPITFDSLIYAAVLGEAAKLCEAIGKTRQAEEYLERKAAVIDAVNRLCYDEKEEYYRDAPNIATYSQHTAVWAVLSEAVTGEKAKKLITRAMTDMKAKCSFSMNHFMFRALEKAGVYDEFANDVLNGWRKMLDMGCTTWCENPDEPRSECHAWSSAPIYEFSAIALGVRPDGAGFTSMTVKPDFDFCHLSFAEGVVPTPKGNVTVAWKKENGHVTLDITAPKDLPMTVILPGMKPETVTATSYRKEINL